MARLRIGLIGAGRHGARYARHLREDFPELSLAGIWRRDPEAALRQAQDWGCRTFSDYRELIADADVDAIAVIVPPTLHRDIVEVAASFGKPVLLEKPAASCLRDGAAMLAAVRRCGLPVMVAQTLRFNNVVVAVRAALERIGRVHAIRLSQRFEPSRPGWIDDPAVAGGGVMLHTGVHSFDLLRHLGGQEAESVSCAVSSVGTARTEDNFVATVRLADGTMLASVAGSRATGSRSGPIEIAGDGGQIIADHVLNTASLVRGNEVETLAVGEPALTVREAIGAFASALADSRPLPIPLEEGLRAVALVEACYEAARTGGSVRVAAID